MKVTVASFKANHTSRYGGVSVEDRLSQLCKDSQGTLQLVLLISSSKSLGLVYASCHQVDHEMLQCCSGRCKCRKNTKTGNFATELELLWGMAAWHVF